jgi:CheY-like chemotaxis protein
MPTHRKSILIVEDDEAIRMILKRLLESYGYVVFLAEHANEGYEKAKILHPAGHPHLILTDVDMAGDGHNLVKKLENDPDLKSIPIIVETAAAELSELSGKKVLRKPFHIDNLLGLVEGYVGKGHEVEDQFRVDIKKKIAENEEKNKKDV